MISVSGCQAVWHGVPDMLVKHTAVAKLPEENNYSDDIEDYASAYNFHEQVVSQCLTNAFSQRSEGLVPSIGCTLDEMIIYLYDPKQDILLRRFINLQLFEDACFSLESIIELWVILNLHLFKPVMKDKVEHVECGFINILKKRGGFRTF